MEAEAEILTASGNPALDKFETYEAYLDSYITPADLYFLTEAGMARQLVELGYHGRGDVAKRSEFEARKRAVAEAREARLHKDDPKVASGGRGFPDNPLLQALADREADVRSGRLSTVVYIRDRNAGGQEVSGYVDYGHRLAQEGSMEAVFEGRRRLLPRPTDLSFFNWVTQSSAANHTPTFQVIMDEGCGLLFKNKRDRKVIDVDPNVAPGDNTTRTDLAVPGYVQVVLFDHIARKRG